MRIGDKVRIIKDKFKGEVGVVVDIAKAPKKAKDKRTLYLVDLPGSKFRGGFMDWMREEMDNKGKDVTAKTGYFNREDLEVL